MRARLTIAQAKEMPFEDLIKAAHALIEPYEAPEGPELPDHRDQRIDRTLAELPDVYGWMLQLESYFDHWTDFYAITEGMKSETYKGMRERRDAMERAASAAKLRYEGTSRELTRLLGHDEGARMPRTRG